MVEVFKTNVTDSKQADFLIRQIQQSFKNYKVNFDLEDCDHILRVECPDENVPLEALPYLLKLFGYEAEVLPDEIITGKATITCGY
jgi:hypothetical protein